MSYPDRPIVIVSNRGPVTFTATREADRTVIGAKRGSGGLVSGLAPLLESGDARWVAAALGDGDRLFASIGSAESPFSPASTDGDGRGLVIDHSDALSDRVDLVTMTPEELSAYYDVVSNETLWFIHHGLYDLVRSPSFGDDWWDAWATYEVVNARFAGMVAETAPEGAAILVQDYHLTLVGEFLRDQRPDLSLVHFHHTPFSGPDNLRVLPDRARNMMLRALAGHDAVGFHTHLWGRNFQQSLDIFGMNRPDRARTFSSTLSSDIDAIRQTADSPECSDELARLNERYGDQKLVVRVDRMELSKNIVRGFEAFDLMLETRPDLRGRVSFLACCYPSRENVAAYRRYRDEVVSTAQRVNERWANANWTPIDLETDDNYPRSVAALQRYDALLVNPIRDGLNLVAKEGPAINERSGQLVLSTQAGAWTEMSDAAFGVHPFDVSATAAALASALDLDLDSRAERADVLRSAATARTPGDWLTDQLNGL